MENKKLTTEKNPGRVEAGKKLAAWNRENKAKLKQEPSTSQEPESSTSPSSSTSTSSTSQEPESSTSPSSSTSTSPGILSIVKSSHVLVFLAGLGAYFGLAYVFGRSKGSVQAEQNVTENKTEAVFDPWKH